MEQELRQAFQRLQRRMAPGEHVPLSAFLPAVQPLAARDPQVCVDLFCECVGWVDGDRTVPRPL